MDQDSISDQNPRKIPQTIGCMLAIGFLGIVIMVFSPVWEALSDIYEDFSFWGKLIFWGIILCVVGFIAIKLKKPIRLVKVVEGGTAISKPVKIVDFVYKSGGEDSRSGCYIILSDGEKNYDSLFHEGARVVGGKTEEWLKNDKFYEENGIILDLENRDITKQQLDEKISDLELKKKGLNFFQKLKMNQEIGEFRRRKEDLEPYHLHSSKGDFYIGDSDKVLIDPEDPDNYILESETKREF